MRVRHILPGFGRIPSDPEAGAMSGVVGVAYNLARQQAGLGWDAELIGLAAPDAPSGSSTLSGGLRVTAVRPWGWFKIGGYDYRYFAPASVRLLQAGQADIHHVYSNPYHLAMGRAVHRVLHYQTPISEVIPAYQRAIRRADAVICCSEFIRGQFVRHLEYPSGRIYVVPNGVDLERFRPGERAAMRACLDISQSELVILFVGQVNEAKGLLHLLKAFRSLAPDWSARLVVAGSSGLWGGADKVQRQTSYQGQVAEAARGLPVTFLGKTPQADMPGVYQAADIFVCPSAWDEPFALVNLEAMATGLPVVATLAGGSPEAVVDDITGLLVPPADAGALAGALRKLLENPELRCQMGEAGLRRIQAFGWRAIAAEIERIYADIGRRE